MVGQRGRRWAWWVLALVGCGGAVEEGPVRDEAPALVAEAPVEPRAGANHQGAPRWAKRLTGPGDELAEGVAVDRDGNIVVLAGFSGSLADDKGTLATAPGEGFAVVKYRPDGMRLWSRSYMGFASALAVDRDRDVFIVGGQERGIVHEPSLRFLRKLDRDGDTEWTREWPMEASGFFAANRLATDREGHILMAGSLEGTLHIDGHTVAGSGQAVIVKLSPSGHFLWDGLGPQFSYGNALAVDEEGFAYLGGTFQTDLVGPVDFIPFVFRFSPGSGTRLWEKYLDSTFGIVNGLAVHGNRVVAVGEFFEPLTFGGRTFTPSADSDGFVVALTRDGEERWARAFGVTALDVAADLEDDITVVGRHEKGDDAGLGPLPGVAGSDFNLFVARYDRVHGEPRWTRGYPQARPDDVDVSGARYQLATSRHGVTTVFGSLVAPVDFGPVTLSPAPGSRDLFLLELNP